MGSQTSVRKVVDYIVLEVQKKEESYWNEEIEPKWIQKCDWESVKAKYDALKQ